MENWGLITYRTTAVLFDEEQSDAKYKNRVAYVVAHGRTPTSITFGCAADHYLELAHQWFGNLVTMDWWNELWLNEGFATWVGWLAVNHLYPDHEVWSQVRTLFSLFFHFHNPHSRLYECLGSETCIPGARSCLINAICILRAKC